MTKNTLTYAILAAMFLGIITGEGVRRLYPDPATIQAFAENISLLSDVFMRLIKTIIAPLVFSTLVVGIAKLGDVKAIGRLGGKTLLYFLTASLVSLVLGMILVNLFQPGVHMHLPLPSENANAGLAGGHFDLKNFLHHVVPGNIIEAMAQNEILQIVVFSIFFGIAAATTGDRGEPLIAALDGLGHVMLRVTGYVMLFAPPAVFGAAAGVVAQKGLGVLATYGLLIGEFYLALLLLWTLLVLFGFLVLGGRVKALVSRLRGPFLLAFSTASSEAAFPKTLQELERFGCPNRIASFVLPLGYSFNLDGSMMYMTFAALFIAQAYGIPLDFGQQITLLLTLMLTSKGIAGVPRASLVVIAGALSLFDIPEAGLLLLLPIDHFLDMGRSATNVLGNAVATSVLSKWEGQLRH
ncbi:dicarboxylate/amino acid:cation symporter [Methylomagnum sp.]